MSGEENIEEAAAAAVKRSLVASLRRERAGYVTRGLDERVAGVDAELKRLGAAKELAEEREPAEPLETAVESKPRRTAGRGGKTGG
ncbi:hypothetical protein OG369_09820 [Streptomyces sp. NBC_01221]|uniref:hypothetical protein n=1 Tax=Streptomyces sp. NBC_01221 TaxID=2903782 RepID=UPI0022529FA9|nr:hypothetical protein [Streptomyces sp. NBC_01221]MCX4786468.1 hypothetical protein [Streptomyces sp. NBC_01221]